MVWQSPSNKIGFPSGGTCSVPGVTASESKSLESCRDKLGPSRRAAMRSESNITAKGVLTSEVCASAVKRDQSGPRTIRKIRFPDVGVTQEEGAVHFPIR